MLLEGRVFRRNDEAPGPCVIVRGKGTANAINRTRASFTPRSNGAEGDGERHDSRSILVLLVLCSVSAPDRSPVFLPFPLVYFLLLLCREATSLLVIQAVQNATLVK